MRQGRGWSENVFWHDKWEGGEVGGSGVNPLPSPPPPSPSPPPPLLTLNPPLNKPGILPYGIDGVLHPIVTKTLFGVYGSNEIVMAVFVDNVLLLQVLLVTKILLGGCGLSYNCTVFLKTFFCKVRSQRFCNSYNYEHQTAH